MKPLINFQTIIFFSTGLFLVPAIISAQQTVQKFTEETNYLLSLPDNYNADTTLKCPLVLFLHGSDESGFDIEKVKAHGPPQQAALGRKLPFILVSPQSEVPSGWDIEKLYRLLQYFKKNYRVDIARIYLTGLSMGGFGIWALAIKHPEEFAAIAQICGGGDTTDTWKIRNIPIWCFHGASDNIVPADDNLFFLRADRNMDIQFNFENGIVTSFWFLGDRKLLYRKLQISV